MSSDWLHAPSLISQKCQPPSSPCFPPSPCKMNNVKSMMPMSGAVWMTDLNKMANSQSGNKKLALIQQQTDAISLSVSFSRSLSAECRVSTAVWKQREGWTAPAGAGRGRETWTWGRAVLTGCGVVRVVLAAQTESVAKMHLATEHLAGSQNTVECNKASHTDFSSLYLYLVKEC